MSLPEQSSSVVGWAGAEFDQEPRVRAGQRPRTTVGQLSSRVRVRQLKDDRSCIDLLAIVDKALEHVDRDLGKLIEELGR